METTTLVDEVRKRLLIASQVMRREAEGLPVTTAQAAVLSRLRVRPMAVGDLARAEGVRPPSMTQIINRMEEAGWLTRPDGAGKGRLVELSEHGRQIAVDIRAKRNALLAQRIEQLSPDDLMVLEAVMPVFDRLFGTPLPG